MFEETNRRVNGSLTGWCREGLKLPSDALEEKVADEIIHIACAYTEEQISAHRMIQMIRDVIGGYDERQTRNGN